MNATGATSKSRVFELIQLLCWVPRWRMDGRPNFHYQLPKCEALKAGNKFHSKLWVKFKVSGSRKGCFDRDLRNTIPAGFEAKSSIANPVGNSEVDKLQSKCLINTCFSMEVLSCMERTEVSPMIIL